MIALRIRIRFDPLILPLILDQKLVIDVSDPHFLAEPDPGKNLLADPDPKHWYNGSWLLSSQSVIVQMYNYKTRYFSVLKDALLINSTQSFLLIPWNFDNAAIEGERIK